MIQPQTDIEPAGINAKDHPCEVMVEMPLEEGEEKPQVKKCRILALNQCQTCTRWICGTEELEHAIICVRCGQFFCPEHFQEHRLANNCLPEVA